MLGKIEKTGILQRSSLLGTTEARIHKQQHPESAEGKPHPTLNFADYYSRVKGKQCTIREGDMHREFQCLMCALVSCGESYLHPVYK